MASYKINHVYGFLLKMLFIMSQNVYSAWYVRDCYIHTCMHNMCIEKLIYDFRMVDLVKASSVRM